MRAAPALRAGLLAGLVMGACATTRSPLLREALLSSVRPAEGAAEASRADIDLLSLIVPNAASSPAPFAPPLPADDDDPFLKCAMDVATRHLSAATQTCGAVLSASRHSGTSEAALHLLFAMREDTAGPALLAASSREKWLAACRRSDASCAEVARLSAALAGSPEGSLSAWQVTGPLRPPDFITEERIAEEGIAESVFAPGPHTLEKSLHAPTGRVHPARHDRPGWYRLDHTVDFNASGRVVIAGRGRVAMVTDEGAVVRDLGGVDGEALSLRVSAQRGARIRFYHEAPHAGAYVQVSAFSDEGTTIARAAGSTTAGPVRWSVPVVSPLDDTSPALAVAALTLTGRAPGRRATDLYERLPRTTRNWGAHPAIPYFITEAVGRLPGLPVSTQDALRRRAASLRGPPTPQAVNDWGAAMARVRQAVSEDDREQARAEARALVGAAPDEPWAHSLLLDVFQGQANRDAAKSARALLNAEGATYGQLLRAAGAFGAVFDIERQRQCLARAASTPGAPLVDVLVQAAVAGDEATVAATIAKAERAGGNRGVDDWRLARWALTQPDEAALLLARRIDAFPNDTSRYGDLIAAVGEADPVGAATLKRLWRIAPDDPRFWLERAEVGMGALTEYFASARAETSARATRFAASRQSPDAPADADASGSPVGGKRYVVDDTAQWFFDDLSSYEQRSVVVALDSDEAVEQYGEWSIEPDVRVLQWVVHAREGGTREPEIVAGLDVLAVPGLARGDVIEMHTVHFNAAPPFPAPMFQTYRFDADAPLDARMVRASWPKTQTARLIAENGAPAVRIKHQSGRTFATWQVGPQPARVDEPYAVRADAVLPVAGVAFRDSEQHWAVWRHGAFESDTAPNAFWRAVAEQVAGAGPRRVQLERLFRYVAQTVTPGLEQKALPALLLGAGQRHRVYAALVRGLGRSAVPFACEPGIGFPAPGLPTPDRFFFPVVIVDGDPETSVGEWGETLTFGALPPGLAEGRRLNVSASRAAESSWFGFLGLSTPRVTPIERVDETPLRVQVQLSERESGRFEGTALFVVPPSGSLALQSRLRPLLPEQLRAAFTALLQPTFPAVSVDEVLLSSAEHLPEGLRIAVTFTLPTAERRSTRFEHLFDKLNAAALGLGPDPLGYLETSARARSVHIIGIEEQIELQVDLLSGSTFVATPASADVRVGPFSLRQTVEVTDGRLFFSRVVHVEHAVLTPEGLRALTPKMLALDAPRSEPLEVLRVPAP